MQKIANLFKKKKPATTMPEQTQPFVTLPNAVALAGTDTIAYLNDSEFLVYGNSNLKKYNFVEYGRVSMEQCVIWTTFQDHKWCSMCAHKSKVYIFAGITSTMAGAGNTHGQRNDLFCYDLDRKTWDQVHYADDNVHVPEARNSGVLLYREARDSLVVFGGYGQVWLDACYEFDLKSKKWKHIVTKDIVKPRTQTCGAYRRKNDSVVYFGGYTGM